MKVYPEKLDAQLARGLAPVYLVAGNEPLLLEEAADAIRAAARGQGYGDREVLFAETGFDWQRLAAAGASLSLFASKRLLELRLPSGKPGDAGAQALKDYAARPAEDTVLLVLAGKPERTPAWVTALEKAGVYVQVWPVDIARLPAWIGQRMRQKGLKPTPDAVQLIASRVEGNLLAAAQEVDKLALLAGPGEVDAETVRTAVADSARFDVFQCVDAALAGEAPRAVRMLEGLRAEGAAVPLLLWALAREVRTLAGLAFQRSRGVPENQLLARVWDKRRGLTGQALRRHDARQWRRLIQAVARLDRIAKGAAPGEAWEELIKLVLEIAGRPALQGADQ